MGFEVVVRPAVVPNIRPAPARTMLPPDAPDKGFATISGSGGGIVDLPYSYSFSVNWGHQEVQRTFEKVLIPYTNPDGTLDWSHTTEAEIVTHMDFTPTFRLKFDRPIASESLQLIGSETRKSQKVGG